jgi:membrane fusion protein (multidrug efflux system)
MSRHSAAFEADRPAPAQTVQDLLPPQAPKESSKESSKENLRGNPKESQPPASEAPAPPVATKGSLRQLLLAGTAVALLAGAAWYGWDYWTVGRFLVSTDDAYVKADNTTIAPRVSGYLSEVLAGDNQRVKAGQVLARIDDRDFKVALDQAKADVAAAQAAVASKQAQLEVQQTVIDAAKATIDVDTATKTFTNQENKRYTDLAATGYGSVQNAQQAQSRNAGAEAAILRDTANLASAKKQVELLKAEIAQATAAAARATAQQTQAELNLSYTTITAPIDGVVGNRTLRTGQFVQAGTQLMSLVPAPGA